MTAREVKDALYARHPATATNGQMKWVGPWTVIEEWLGIDVLALSAYKKPPTAAVKGADYPRVGYEVKVSRSDYRRELLRPSKRALARDWCHAFYFAVPRGLLKPDELAWEEPEWGPRDFNRTPCPEGRCYRGKRWNRETLREEPCETCEGRGHLGLSRAELEAPTLWVPRDVGLVVVDGRGCTVARQSPVRAEVPELTSWALHQFTRWVSARPDPRHVGLNRPIAEVA